MFARSWCAVVSALVVSASASLTGCAAETATEGDGDEAAPGESSEDALTTEPEYQAGKLHSKMSAAVVLGMQEIARGNRGAANAFIKVGDSITFSDNFLDCLDRATLTADEADLEATRAFFDGGSWQRRSKASTVGWHTNQPLAGSPAPLDVEIGAMKPRLAVVMLGTNDNYVGTDAPYRRNLSRLIDALLAKNIVPILSTIPPRAQATPNANIPRMNAIVRSVASGARTNAQGQLVAGGAKKIPLMDFNLALSTIPRQGLSGDGIHPNVAPRGACDFGETGMGYGYNVRTHLALEAIDRVKRFVLDGSSLPE